MIHCTRLLLLAACLGAPPVLAADGAPDAEPRWAVGVGIHVAAGSADPSRNPPTHAPSGPAIVIRSEANLSLRSDPVLDMAGPDLAVGVEARLTEGWWIPVSAVMWSWPGDWRGASVSTGVRRMWRAGGLRPSLHLNLGVGLGTTWGDIETRQLLGAVGGSLDVPLMGPLWLRGSLDVVAFRREWWGEGTDYTGFSLLPATRVALWTRF